MVILDNPSHAQALKHLGLLAIHQDFNHAVEYLTKSIEADSNDAQSWYLLGRTYMSQTRCWPAYECYQQAIYRDTGNFTFWCSVGVLYFHLQQFPDATHAFRCASQRQFCSSEVWFNIGIMNEICQNPIADILDAYGLAIALAPDNTFYSQRLQSLNTALAHQQVLAPPHPADVQVLDIPILSLH